jgi:hypothetical protein
MCGWDGGELEWLFRSSGIVTLDGNVTGSVAETLAWA